MRTYIYPYFPLPYVIQVLADSSCIKLRSFKLSGGILNHSNALQLNEARDYLNQDFKPFIPSRATPENSWIPREALDGFWAGGSNNPHVGSHLQEVSQVSFKLDSAILGAAAISEHAEWIVPCSLNGHLSMPINRTLLTQPARSHKTAVYQDRQQCTALTVMMPYADNTFNRAVLFAKVNPSCGLVHNFLEAVVVSPDGIMLDNCVTRKSVEWIWPQLKINGQQVIQSAGTEKYSVSLHDADSGFILDETGMRVELEASAGYLAHRTLRLHNGTATFSVSALGLSPGEQIKLKAGWRNYPGAAEKIITVV